MPLHLVPDPQAIAIATLKFRLLLNNPVKLQKKLELRIFMLFFGINYFRDDFPNQHRVNSGALESEHH